jgi:hypothetical protein
LEDIGHRCSGTLFMGRDASSRQAETLERNC